MKALAAMLASAVMAFGYWYWDSFDIEARITSLSAVSGISHSSPCVPACLCVLYT
ncbi:MAG: hypothetical protein KAR40_02310 [Candidatus Sabulitectum sp.]|nr:hypothetical protein [Candidatus Sabulitectum sp.]